MDGHWYDVDWQRADESDAKFFRPNEGLGKDIIEQAKKDEVLKISQVRTQSLNWFLHTIPTERDNIRI